MIARRVVVLLGTMVVSVASLARVFASIYNLEIGRRKIAEAVTSRAGACGVAPWICWDRSGQVVYRSGRGADGGCATVVLGGVVLAALACLIVVWLLLAFVE